MITLVARTGLGVHWQGWAGVTQRALAVLLIEFYASMQTAMNAAIQQRKGSKAKRRKLCACVCVCFKGLAKVGYYTVPASDVNDPGGISCLLVCMRVSVRVCV